MARKNGRRQRGSRAIGSGRIHTWLALLLLLAPTASASLLALVNGAPPSERPIHSERRWSAARAITLVARSGHRDASAGYTGRTRAKEFSGLVMRIHGASIDVSLDFNYLVSRRKPIGRAKERK